MSEAIAAIATGNQVCAIGIVRLSGEGVIEMARQLFTPERGPGLSLQPDRKLCYGRLCRRDGSLLDLCLATVSRAPNSYTGEDTVEFQCHGSPLLLRTVLEELFALGARQAGPGEFTKRAFLNGRLGLSEAEAVADLIDAESDEALRNAAGQLSGAIHRKAEEIYSALSDISAHYHAVLDYPDEDIEDFQLRAYEEVLRKSLEELERLLKSFQRGKLMNAGIPTAIVGRPNAGKSSLLNALLGYERAIVTAVPGTTRDTIEERLHLGGLCLRLTDTAGIRETEDEVERLGVQRSRAALEGAELVIAVVDGSRDYTGEDREILRAAERARHGLVVLSKRDLSAAVEHVDTSLPVIPLSSVTGEGLDRLEAAIAALFPLPQTPAGEILTNARQAEAVGRAAESLRAALEALDQGLTPDLVLTESETAMSALGELTGRSVRQDVTDRIFQRFCVGK